jgi:hypothetical protein
MTRIYIIIGTVALLVATAWVIDRHGYQRGQAEERAQWQARESAELADANQLIDKLQRDARAKERAHAAALSVISSRYQEELADANRKHKDVIADIRAGRVRLRDPSAGETSCAGGTAAAPPAAGWRDGPPGGELSRSAAEFLFGLAAEADAVAHQLAACQAVVRRDRE